jgi:hypothetical protein
MLLLLLLKETLSDNFYFSDLSFFGHRDSNLPPITFKKVFIHIYF